MSAVGLASLQEVPVAVRQAADVIAGIDRCLLVGFGRLGSEELDALQRFGSLFTETPLHQLITEALAALNRREYTPWLGVALAAARAALQGAQHDALASQAAAALGRTVATETAPPEPPAAEDGPIAVWRDSTQHWLMELAQTGFQHLDTAAVGPFAATLQQVQDEPRLSRWAALLTGFHQELLHAVPVGSLADVPVFRWADLWTRSMVLSLRPTMPLPSGRPASGLLAPFGVEVRQHGSFVSFVVHAVLQEDAPTPRLVRLTLSSYKVDALRGEELWCALDKTLHSLLQALSEHGSLKVQGLTLLPTGDLLWSGAARKGPAFAVMEWAAQWLRIGAEKQPALPATAAVDGHALQLASPVFLEGVQVESLENGGTLTAGDGARLPVVLPALGPVSALAAEHLARAKNVLGLLRFDGGRWAVQPLGVDMGGKAGAVFVGDGAYEAATKKRKQDTLKILRERASRLLRKKA